MATFRIEQPPMLMSRSRDGRWLGGVCPGLIGRDEATDEATGEPPDGPPAAA